MSTSKEARITQVVPDPSAKSPAFGTLKANSRARDEALDFLESHRGESNAALYLDKVYVAQLKRKIDRRFLPFGFVVITFNIIDKVLLNVRAFAPSSCILSV